MRLYWPEERRADPWRSKAYSDIPGTTVFDADQSRKGYWPNQSACR
jgi:hypothetical protein